LLITVPAFFSSPTPCLINSSHCLSLKKINNFCFVGWILTDTSLVEIDKLCLISSTPSFFCYALRYPSGYKHTLSLVASPSDYSDAAPNTRFCLVVLFVWDALLSDVHGANSLIFSGLLAGIASEASLIST
jgi:hypothetical protein